MGNLINDMVIFNYYNESGEREMNKECPICSNKNAMIYPTDRGKEIDCPSCGLVMLPIRTELKLNVDKSKYIKLASVLRKRSMNNRMEICIFVEGNSKEGLQERYPMVSLDELLSAFPNKVSDRIDQSLVNLAKLSEYPGHEIYIGISDSTLFFVQSENLGEMEFLMQQLKDDGYITGSVAGLPTSLKLTVKGWNRVAELERNTIKNNEDAFVAMWFDTEVENAYEEAIVVAIKEAGYNPIRIDKVDHNNKICDEIIAKIQRSKFVIADFTGQRGGVYFEAGYAMGLGKPVIWTCRHDHLDKVHFDTRQYSHIVWETEEDLKEKLFNRIRATIN